MAKGVEGFGEAAVVDSSTTDSAANGNAESSNNVDKESGSNSEFRMEEVSDTLSKLTLNPMAEEFIPSSYLVISPNYDQFGPAEGVTPANYQFFGSEGYPFYRRRRHNFNQRRRRSNGRAFGAQREDSIKRTVYVSELDHNVTEEQLADLFSSKCGQVVDCRICGDPHSRLHFAFVEFADETSAKEALNFGGTLIGFYPIKVLPSKTAILPVNPTFLPRSEDEREMCARTVYCTNIDKEISQAAVKFFFASYCGEVSRLRLLGDNVHATRICFVEFSTAESAIAALDCSGRMLGNQALRVSPSKTPVRPRPPRPVHP